MRIAIVLGTRPEIIKMSSLIRACVREGRDFFVIHTGQHYSHGMDRVFFEELELPAPEHKLDVGSGRHGEQTAKMLAGIERVLEAERPDCVLVEGDTNTVVAGALAASKLQIGVGHVEAGLRSFDRTMPEELNRIVADHLSDWLFAPTEASRALLLREGLPDAKIHVTGNTIADAVLEMRSLAAERSDVLARLGLDADHFVLMTAHRQENVDDRARFAGILEGARAVGRALGLPVVYPAHPRAKKMLATLGLEGAAAELRVVEPVGFLDFLRLEATAHLVLTDSGGVQEETCILDVPCVTLRDNTERPETVDVGANVLAGVRPDVILEKALAQRARPRGWAQPFGDGRAAEKILAILDRGR
ncbi:UDP-N-acetylglucosamine 2-epimerase (non-hydrolyzing) [Myxococcota bacterium]|nr:UDP-N-acetylglucosamine 2-epimerase (non-hydrolyzing) [Myxococcota bacterium]